MTDLKDTVKRLEGQMKALKVEHAAKGVEEEPHDVQLTTITPPADAGRRVDDLKRQHDELAAQFKLLQGERAQLQQTLETHKRFIEAVYAASTSSEDEDSDEDNAHSIRYVSSDNDQPMSPWREPAVPETSDEDFSPDKRKKTKFYSSPRPAYVQNPMPRAPLSTALWKEIGYKHLTLTQARAFVNETYQSILGFALSGRALSTGARVMGWEDKRLVDGTTIKFSLRKQFMGENANALMTKTWMCFSDPVCADEKFRGLMTVKYFVYCNNVLDCVVSDIYVCVWLVTNEIFSFASCST